MSGVIYCLERRFCSMLCGVFSVQQLVCSFQCAVFSVQCSVCSVQCAVFSVQCAIALLLFLFTGASHQCLIRGLMNRNQQRPSNRGVWFPPKEGVGSVEVRWGPLWSVGVLSSCNFRSTVFSQKSWLHTISESMDGTLYVKKEQRRSLLLAPAEDFHPRYILWTNWRLTRMLQQWQWVETVVLYAIGYYNDNIFQSRFL